MLAKSPANEKKWLSFALVGLFLFLISVEVQVHNHPLWQKENNSCPAYILSLTVHAEQIPHVDFQQELKLLAENIFPETNCYSSQTTTLPFHRRGPPTR